MTEIISVDIDSLDPHLDPKGNDQLVIRNKVTGKDQKVAVSTLLGSGSGDDFPEWDKDTIFNITGNKYCIEDERFWKSLQAGNQDNRPTDDDPGNPVWWTEISESVGSAIREWAAGFYRANDVVVKRNSKLYELISPTRPYESADFVAELAAGDWKLISGITASADKEISAQTTASDGDYSGATLSKTPNGYVALLLNSVQQIAGDAVKTKDYYWSRNGGTTALALLALKAGDRVYWNGSIAGIELDEDTDIITLNYSL